MTTDSKPTAMRWMALLFFAATGCATLPLADVREDARVKGLAAPSDGAIVYVYRNETYGGAVRMPLLVDGGFGGETSAKTYLAFRVRPGPHTVISRTENDARLDFVAEPGRKYYVWQEVKMGLFSARSNLQLVPENVGRAGLSECNLLQVARASR